MSKYNDLKNSMLIVCVPCAIIAAVMCHHQKSRVDELNGQLQLVKTELAHAQIPLKRDTIHDSIEVVTQTVVEVVQRKMKEALAEQTQTIRDLKLRVKQLEAAQTTVVEINDSVPAQHDQADNKFFYSDQWADLSLQLKDTTFYYNIRDSLAAYVYREYKHRFLWWRWGTKGYQVKIVNFNPHARVTYNKYVKAEK